MPLATVRDLCQKAAELHAAGAFAAAQAVAETAVQGCREEPGLGRRHYSYAMCLCTLAVILQAQGLDATPVVDEALEVGRQLAEDDSEHALVILHHAVEFALTSGRDSWAQALSSELAALNVSHLGPDHPRTQAWDRSWPHRLAGRK